MDDKRFDYLTRQVARQANRRTMFKTALGGTLALLGIAGLDQQSEARNNQNNKTGYEDDPCATNDDCLQGLRCQGARQGIAPGFPISAPIDIPVITGKEGICEYTKACGGERGDACRRNDDCCNGLTCDSNRCKRS